MGNLNIKKILLIFMSFFCFASAQEAEDYRVTDKRDDKIYAAKKIGKQIWLVDNLSYNKGNCYNNNIDNCSKYGRLYTWSEAKKACPGGFKLPSKKDWEILFEEIGSSRDKNSFMNAGKILKVRSWRSSNTSGTNDYDFAATPGGFCFASSNSGCDGIDTKGKWWTETEVSSSEAYSYYIGAEFDDVIEASDFKDFNMLSVRCIKR